MMEKESGVKVWASGEHRDGTTGKLIVGSHAHGGWWIYFFGNWDAWRTNYCEKHRVERLPVSFRKGNVSVVSLITSIYLKVVEKCS